MGLFDKLKGKAKEATGNATGSDTLRVEGQAQQRKSDEELSAWEARREAERHEEKAAAHERVERGHQGT